MTDDRVVCRTPTKGRDGVTRLPRWKYDCVRAAIVEAVKGAGAEGFPMSELAAAVRARLSAEELSRLGSVSWHMMAVKLNLEVENEISRLPGVTPQRLVTGPKTRNA